MGLYGALWGSVGHSGAPLWVSLTLATTWLPTAHTCPQPAGLRQIWFELVLILWKLIFAFSWPAFNFSKVWKMGVWGAGLFQFRTKGPKCQFLNSSLHQEHCCRIISEIYLLICLSYFGGHHLLWTFEKWKCETFGNGNGNEHNIAFNFIKSSPDLSEHIKTSQHSSHFCIPPSKAYICAKI